MRSVHMERSTQLKGRASPACLAVSGTATGIVSLSIDTAHPPSYVPSLHGHYAASSLIWTL